MDVQKIIEAAVSAQKEMVTAADEQLNPALRAGVEHEDVPVGENETQAEAQEENYESEQDEPLSVFTHEPSEEEGLSDERPADGPQEESISHSLEEPFPLDSMQDSLFGDVAEPPMTADEVHHFPFEQAMEFDEPETFADEMAPELSSDLPQPDLVTPNHLPYRDHKPKTAKEQGVNLTVSDGWQADIENVVSQQMQMLQGMMAAQLDDGLSRSINQFDMLGGE